MNTAHERCSAGKDEWLTPPNIIEALGRFDLDPCSPVPDRRPWATADKHLSIEDDGLVTEWEGRVWLNPPYGRETGRWLAKLAAHGNGVALVFARTDTVMFDLCVWPYAHGILFLRGRLTFFNADGTPAKGNAGAPSCLIAYGESNAAALERSGIPGRFIHLYNPQEATR